MRKKYERVYCDCCGKEIEGKINDSKYYPVDPYRVNEFKLPYVVEGSNGGDSNPTYGYEFTSIKDICDECMDELVEFSKKFLKVNQED